MDNMNNMNNMNNTSFFKQHLPIILGVVIIIFGVLVYFEIKGIDLNKDGSGQVLKKVVSVTPMREGFTKQMKKQAAKKNQDKKKIDNKKIDKKSTVVKTGAVVATTSTKESNNVKGFCDPTKFTPSDINNKCGQLSKENCNVTGCCVYLNGNKCVSGDKNGPTFLSNGKGKLLNIDYYYYKNQCYGNCKNK